MWPEFGNGTAIIVYICNIAYSVHIYNLALTVDVFLPFGVKNGLFYYQLSL